MTSEGASNLVRFMSSTRGLEKTPFGSETMRVATILDPATHRTADLTSTTRREITLTTSEHHRFSTTYAKNVFEENDVLNLPDHGVGPGALLSVVSLGTVVDQTSERDALLWKSVAAAKKAVETALRSYRPWLLVCVGGPDNATTKRKGLAGLMRDAGVAVSIPPFSATHVQKDDGGRYFFGVFGPLTGDLEFLRGFITASSRSLLAFFPKEARPDATSLVSTGWWRGVGELLEVRDIGLRVVAQEGVLLRPFGVFDDREVGVDILARGGQFLALSRAVKVER